MSRIIVKNLPKKITSEDVKAHFATAGTITDVNLKYKNGEFRRFAFVGFVSPEEAQNAYRQFKDTYIKQCKLQVEMCKDKCKLEEPEKVNAEKAEKVEEEDIAETKRKNKTFKNLLKYQIETLNKEKLKELMKDPQFVTYMTVNKKGASSLVQFLNKKYSISSEEDKMEKENNQISNVEYLQQLSISNSVADESKIKKTKWKELYTVVIRTKEQNTDREKKGRTFTKKGVKSFFQPLKCKSLRIPCGMSYVAYVGFQTEKALKQALLKDKSFLDGVRVRVHKYEKCDGKTALNSSNAPWGAAAEKLRTVAQPVEETGKIFIRNLWYSTTEEDLKKLLEEIGPIADITLPLCKETRKVKGFAHVSFVLPEHAAKAICELDGMSFQGRPLHILPSILKEDDNLENLSFKDKRKAAMKNPSSWHNWNSLFLGSEAVIDLISEKLQHSKQEILRNDGNRNQSVAATLALGEAQLVEETKKFLEEEGVSLEAFTNPGMQRSSTVLLVKHLPAHTTAHELSQLFSAYGELGRVVLPPTGVTGLVEFLDSAEAKLAYKDLAYSRFKHLPLYLEWAPVQTFTTEVQKKKSSKKDTVSIKSDEVQNSMGNPEPNTTLYVKNLNFNTDEEALKKHFSKIGPVYSVSIAKKRCLSQGYGFVQYYKASDAKKALMELQNSCLQEHDINLKYSEKSLVPEDSKNQEVTGSSKLVPIIIVKNIPFESPLSEIKEIFSTFGGISSVRLPRRMGSDQHRGFCFVEFLDRDSAKKAFATLSSSTHLRGRRLVLEWAKDNESLDELRKRTADHFLSSGSKKRKKIEMLNSSKHTEEI